MKKIVLILVMLVMIGLASGIETLGTFKKGECIDLFQSGENLTACNITSVRSPYDRISMLDEVEMTQDGIEFNYTFCNSSLLGQYVVNGFCVNGSESVVWAYDFYVTGTGFEFTQARSLFYLISIVLLIFLFILSLITVSKLPDKNPTDDYGLIISVSHLKYLRPVLYSVAWFLLIAVLFTSSNIAFAYLGTEMFGKFFFMLYQVMFWLTIPFMLLWVMFILVNIFRDAEVKRLIERGVEIRGTP